ncbi:AAA family ATPase [Skermanella stibiiresistens]|uniref:AAA family ATPase n=1 Tax=Skermanella stibiiresistens TaxID=913326 RepID=UPI0012F984C2|nr:AAA family ATPase [Skermanella stibiiresistens]
MDYEILAPDGSPLQPIQKILFGPPGTGKSHHVGERLLLDCDWQQNVVRTVFHPEYSYGDFVGKLLPLSRPDGGVAYNYYIGDFFRALARAYYLLISQEVPEPVALIIDEINRGNAPAIFGKVFQLLDRNLNGWSNYAVSMSDMEILALARKVGFEENTRSGQITGFSFIKPKNEAAMVELSEMLRERRIVLPPNLSIIGTMNTSDESIFYLDSAFKRRWNWQYIRNQLSETSAHMESHFEYERLSYDWINFVDAVNSFIISCADKVRRVEDKTIGYWFIKPTRDKVLDAENVREKILFHLWDSVFSRSKQPLSEFLGKDTRLFTFGDFSDGFGKFQNRLEESHGLESKIPF